MFDIPPFKDYIVVDTFNVHELCKEHKAKMVSLYLKKRKKVPIGAMNEEYCNKDFIKAISKKWIEAVHQNFIVGPLCKPIRTWIYVQNDKNNVVALHNHISTSTINGVFYIDPPKEGGETQFLFYGKKFIIKPEINKIYFWPYWLEHTPLSQKDHKWRISVNMEYYCRERPIVKRTGIWW